MSTTNKPSPNQAPPSLARFLKFIPALHSLTTYNGDSFRRESDRWFDGRGCGCPPSDGLRQHLRYASTVWCLYTAIVMTAVGALFASSKQLINGPTNAISIAMLSALASVPAEARVEAAIMMAALIGIIQNRHHPLEIGRSITVHLPRGYRGIYRRR